MKTIKSISLFAAAFLLVSFFTEAKAPTPEAPKAQAAKKQTVKPVDKKEGEKTEAEIIKPAPAVLKWLENYEQACRTAKEQNKPILLYFTGSDWCSWCFYLHKNLLDHKSFIDYANKSIVLMKADFPRKAVQDSNLKKQNQELAQKFRVSGFPTVYLLNPDGKIIGESHYNIDPLTRKPVFATKAADGKVYFAKAEGKMDAGAAYAKNIQEIWSNIQKTQQKAKK